MTKQPMDDVVVLLPGILGSVLEKDGKDMWAMSPGAAFRALLSLGGSIKGLALDGDDPDADDLGDGVIATRLLPDLHLVPGLWKIDGYGAIAKAMRDQFELIDGQNYFEFPYDWRRDNRVHGRRLARQAHDWLAAWRTSSGNSDAKLILLAHSMGGLVSRAFLELFDGWKDTRALITFGTPYRGSLNALSFLNHGMRKGIGPVGLDLTDFLRSLTSVYQLLPIYPSVVTPDGATVRVAETTIEGVDAARAPSFDRVRGRAAPRPWLRPPSGRRHRSANAPERSPRKRQGQDAAEPRWSRPRWRWDGAPGLRHADRDDRCRRRPLLARSTQLAPEHRLGDHPSHRNHHWCGHRFECLPGPTRRGQR